MIVFLLEERSMADMLRGLLPRLVPDCQEERDYILVKHNGKADLEKSIPRKVRSWSVPVHFVVVRDNDGGDCLALKARLLRLAQGDGRHKVLVRIVCQNLESWYMGEMQAVAEAYQRPALARLRTKREYLEPDTHGNADAMLKRVVPEFQKGSGAIRIGPFLDPARSTSPSFRVFCEGVRSISQRISMQDGDEDAQARYP